MDLVTVLMVFVIISTVIKVAVDNINMIMLPYYDIKKYSMTTAFILTFLTVMTYNTGILTVLTVPNDLTLQPYFHYIDLIITIFVLSAGAQAVHQIINGINEYKLSKGTEKK